MDAIVRYSKRHSLAINITINILLALLCVLSYVFLLLLYFSQGLGVASFTYVNRGTIPPTAIVPVFGILLNGATLALLTRSVEHDLWIKLLGNTVQPSLSAESHRRAQWTVSPFARLLYTINGSSLLLRIGGTLLFGAVVVNPVLLYGVSPGVTTQASIHQRRPIAPSFSGFTPDFDRLAIRDSRFL